MLSSPTKPLSWWEDSDILGGRDEVAGGTWLACTRSGRVAFLTNVREINSNSDTKSRGDLPVRFLKVRAFSSILLIVMGNKPPTNVGHLKSLLGVFTLLVAISIYHTLHFFHKNAT